MVDKITLKPAQRAHIDRWLREPTRAIIAADEPGVGKTVKSITFGLDLWAQTVLIVGYRDTFDQFNDRLLAQTDGLISLRRINATKAGMANMDAYLGGERGWFYVGHEFLAAKDSTLVSHNPPRFKNGKETKKRVHLKTWAKVRPDLIIVDEIQKMAARHSRANTTLLSIRGEWNLALSATPFGDQFENFHGVVSWAWPDRSAPGDIADASFLRWKQKYCATADQYVPGGRAIQKVTGEKYPGEFVKLLPCYTRDEGDNPEPPPAIEIYVDLTPGQRRIYDELEGQLLSWIKDHPFAIDFPVTLHNHLYAVSLAEPTVTFTEKDGVTKEHLDFAPDAYSAKADAAIGIIEHHRGEPILHLTHSKRYAHYLANRLQREGYAAAAYTGDVKSADREKVKAGFIDGSIQHIVATAQSLGVGTDGLQAKCRILVWHSKVPGRASLLKQSINRIYRQGGDIAGFLQYALIANDTKDTGIYSNVSLRLAAQQIELRKEGGA